jgi:hypothetical protein
MGKNWNAGVLKAGCASMDFVAVSLVEGKGAPPNWVDNVDEIDLLKTARDPLDQQKYFNMPALDHDYSLLAADLAEKYKKFCPAGHVPQLAITNLGVAPWLPAKNPAAVGMFALDSVAKLIERGAYAVQWSPIHAASPTFLDNGDQPQPAYYGIKLLHQVARVGDTFVAASSPNDVVSVHAVKRRDGGLGLVIINKDLNQPISVTVTVDGYNYAAKGTRYDWGKPGSDPGKSIAEAPIENLGGTFTVVVPRYAITAIVIPKA